MSQENFPTEFVLESIESIMPPSKQPKVILFDIGGVCVASPFQAILDYEISHSIPPGWINYSISRTSPNGFWHRLERGELPLDTTFFTGFTSDLHSPTLWKAFYQTSRTKDPSLPPTTPPLPTISGEEIFWKMMSKSRDFDPWIYPALQSLKASGKFILAALSNTVIFPPTHPYSNPPSEKDIRLLFDVFVSSAHVGLRKPDPKIYILALEKVDEFARDNRDSKRGRELGWEDGVRAEEVVFLDDIGENLKAGRKMGFRTIKVNLGRAFEAVDELEEVTGVKLAGDHPRVPVVPIVRKRRDAGGVKL